MSFEVDAETTIETISIIDTESGERIGTIFPGAPPLVPSTGDQLDLKTIVKDTDVVGFEEDSHGTYVIDSRNFSYVEIVSAEEDDDSEPQTALGMVVELLVSEVE